VRTRAERVPTEDVTGLAGWMYTDLLLALMVVFLATISFIPQLTGTGSGDEDSLFALSEIYETPLTVAYVEPSAPQIRADIETFAQAQGLEGRTVPVAVRIIGAYDPLTESATDALRRSEAARQAIALQDPQLFADASTIIGSTTSLDSPQIVVEITLAVERGVAVPEESR